MTEISVIVTGPEEAYNYEAEFWSRTSRWASPSCTRGACTCASTRARDGLPWLADTASLARALADAEQRLAAY